MTEDTPHEPHSNLTTREPTPSPGRVGDYIPESLLADLSSIPETSPGTEPLESCPTHSASARALARHPDEQAAFAAQRAHRQSLWYKTYKRRSAPPELSDSHQRYLDEAGAFLELPRTTTDALLAIYISTLNDLTPLLDGAAAFRDHSNGTCSTYLVRAICLVACKTKQAAPFLRCIDDGPVLQPLKFASRLLAGLDAAIKADLEPDRVVKIQVLALMHLHNDGLSGTDRSSNHLSHALCEAWSLSLHWNIPGNPDQEQCDFLWWSLRNLDRLNKPVMAAAPFIVNDTDISIQRIPVRKGCYRSQVMGVSLALGDLMAKATKVYKASSTATEDDSGPFPTLAEVTSGIDFDRFHRSHREYLEIWYHVTAMLSCRYSGPDTVQYNRRLTSADCVLAILSQPDHEGPPPLPLVPYAMSISTCVIYRALRDETREPDAAYADLRRCCEVLDALSQRWTSTRGVAKLARKLWSIRKSEPDVTTGYQNIRKGSRVQGSGIPSTESGRRPPTSSSQHHQPGYPTPSVDGTPIAPIPTPPAIQADGAIHRGQVPDSYQPQAWGTVDVSFSQLDMAFHDLFDYSLPNAFRNPTTWEYLNMAGEECSGGLC